VLRDPVFAAGGATTALLEDRFAGWRAPAADAGFARRLYAAARAKAAGFGEWSGWSNAGRVDLPEAPHALSGESLHFVLDGQDFTWRDATMDPPARRAAGFDGRSLASPMNGRVVAVLAKPGDAVSQGSALIVLEAMKMEHTLAAPAALRVSAVHVAKGAQVAPGQLLMEFEPGESK
jgi:biotin carboxyl carrier protein